MSIMWISAQCHGQTLTCSIRALYKPSYKEKETYDLVHGRRARSDNLSDAFIEITWLSELKGFYIHKYVILIFIFQIVLKSGLVRYTWQARICR